MLVGMTMRRATGAVLCLFALGSSAACGSQDDSSSSSSSSSAGSSSSGSGPSGSATPAVCRDAQALQASVEKLQSMKLGQGAAAALSTELKAMHQTIAQLATDASDQYAGQVDAAKSAATSLTTSVQAAGESPSPATLKAVHVDAAALGDAVQNLGHALASTCA